MPLRTSRLILFAALATAPLRAQEAAKVCSDGRTIKFASQWDELTTTLSGEAAAARPLHYSISKTSGVQGAWAEVWDRPKRLSRKGVAIQGEGEAACAACEDAEQTPEGLFLSIYDPAGMRFCINFCGNSPILKGDYVSEMRIGKKPDEDSDESVEPAYLLEFPELTGRPIRVEEGNGSIDVVLWGENLIQSTRVYVLTGEDQSPKSKAPKDYLYSRTLDLRSVLVTIPSEWRSKPGVLTAYVKDSWEAKDAENGSGQKIIVASKDSPVITSVEPRVVDCCGKDATVILRGHRFTEDSEVKFGDDRSIGPEVKFVSAQELRVQIRGEELEDLDGSYARPTPMTLSVVNDPLHFSAPVEVRVEPSVKFKRAQLLALVRSADDGFSKSRVSGAGNRGRQLSSERCGFL
jgi:IPT/TIG domain